MTIVFDEDNRVYVITFEYFGERVIHVTERAIFTDKEAICAALDAEIKKILEEVSNYEANLYF